VDEPTLPFGITERDILSFEEKQKTNAVDNHPLRDMEKTSFFGALMSDEADFIKHGVLSADDVAALL
jgi:hypothetical protein